MKKQITQKTRRPGMWTINRISGFTDSVFAFAITLLVLNLINLHIPVGNESLVPFFRTNASVFITFTATFVIIARFWMSHNQLFSSIRESDRTIVDLNNALLFFITVFPFVASLLGSHIGNRDAIILYAACFAVIGILQYLIGRHAYRNSLFSHDDFEEDFLKVFTFFTLSTPAVFLISIIFAFISPYAAEAVWALLLFVRIGFLRYYKNNRAAEFEIEKL